MKTIKTAIVAMLTMASASALAVSAAKPKVEVRTETERVQTDAPAARPEGRVRGVPTTVRGAAPSTAIGSGAARQIAPVVNLRQNQPQVPGVATPTAPATAGAVCLADGTSNLMTAHQKEVFAAVAKERSGGISCALNKGFEPGTAALENMTATAEAGLKAFNVIQLAEIRANRATDASLKLDTLNPAQGKVVKSAIVLEFKARTGKDISGDAAAQKKICNCAGYPDQVCAVAL